MRKPHSKRGVGPSGADAVSFAAAMARAAAEKLGEEIVVLDLRGRCSVADFFVIVTSRNPRQQTAIADAVDEAAGKVGWRLYGGEGRAEARWTLLDYVDVVVHVFSAEWREVYDLELLWGDAPRLDWETANDE